MITYKDQVIITPDIKFEEKCGGLGVLLHQACLKYQNNIAQINTRNDEVDTYNHLLQKSISAAKALQKRGFKRQHLVALCCDRENINASIPLIAAQFLGCISYSIDPDSSVGDCAELLRQAQPKIIFFIETAKATLTKALQQLDLHQVDLVELGQEFEEEFLRSTLDNDFQPAKVENLNDTCMIHFSSGTTGTPKPILLSHYYFLALKESVGFNSSPCTEPYSFQGGTLGAVSLRYSKWYWVSASFELVTFTLAGGCRLLKDKFTPNEFWTFLEKYHVSDILLTPLQCIELSKWKTPNNCNTSSLKKISTGGYVLHKEFLHDLWKLLPGVFISQVYGMTECGEVTAFNLKVSLHRKLLSEKPESCGLPVPGLQYKVVDLETGKKCGFNQPGELYLKGTKIFSGFYNKDCHKSFDNEGFFRTGDLVYFDNDFCFFVVDRIKSVLGWNDWMIYPHHIEKVLLTHPAVYNAAVIGIPHKIEGERLMGVVMLKSGVKNVTEKELEEFVEKRIEDHKRLREGVKFVTSMPITASGKVNRFKLKQTILQSINKIIL